MSTMRPKSAHLEPCVFRQSMWPQRARASSWVKPSDFSSQVLELLRCSPYLEMALVLLLVQWEHLYPQMNTVRPKSAHLQPCTSRRSMWPGRARASSRVKPSDFSSQVLELLRCSPYMKMALVLLLVQGEQLYPQMSTVRPCGVLKSLW